MPKVTVLTTFHNGRKTIEKAIESILNQSFKDFEYLLVDDGSTDETALLINGFKDERIYLVDPGRIGRAAALNLGLQEAKCDYVAILDADDEAYPNRLFKQKEILDNSQVSLVASNASIFDDCENSLGQTNFSSDHNSLVKDILQLNPFPHSSVMFRRKDALIFSGYNERCVKSIDFNMYLDLLQEKRRFFCIEENLIKLRVYATSWGATDTESLQFFYGYLGLISYYINMKNGKRIMRGDIKDFRIIENIFKGWFYKSDVYKSRMAKQYFHQFHEAIRKGKFNKSIESFLKAFRNDSLFWTYRGFKFNYEEDILNFLEYASKESLRVREILDNEI